MRSNAAVIRKNAELKKGIKGCWECGDFSCGRDMHDVSIHGVRLTAFVRFIKENGLKRFAECIYINEKNGIVYHRDPEHYTGDYDGYASEKDVI